MARGDMGVKTYTVGGQAEILNRPPFFFFSMTIDFSSVPDTDPDTNEKIVKAGTPIDKDGKPQKTTPWTGAVGVLLHDVYESRPQGTILKKAYLNHKRVTAHAGITYDAKFVAAMLNAGCRIVIEDDMVAGTIPDAASAGVGG